MSTGNEVFAYPFFEVCKAYKNVCDLESVYDKRMSATGLVYEKYLRESFPDWLEYDEITDLLRIGAQTFRLHSLTLKTVGELARLLATRSEEEERKIHAFLLDAYHEEAHAILRDYQNVHAMIMNDFVCGQTENCRFHMSSFPDLVRMRSPIKFNDEAQQRWFWFQTRVDTHMNTRRAACLKSCEKNFSAAGTAWQWRHSQYIDDGKWLMYVCEPSVERAIFFVWICKRGWHNLSMPNFYNFEWLIEGMPKDQENK